MNNVRLAPRLTKLARLVQRVDMQNMEALGISSGQKETLRAVLEFPGIHQAALSKTLGVHKSVVSRCVTSLEKAGYVRRIPPRNQKAPRAIVPTRLAQSYQKVCRETFDTLESTLQEGFSPEEWETFMVATSRVSANLERQLAGTPSEFERAIKANMLKELTPPLQQLLQVE